MSDDVENARHLAEATSQWPGLFPWAWAGLSTGFFWLLKHTINSHAEAVKEMREEMREGFADSKREREVMRSQLADVRAHVEHIHGRLDGHDSWGRLRYDRLGG